MTNLRIEIRHGEWFYREFEGAEFRARYYNWGFTYSNLEFQIKVPTRFKKWIFFGPKFYWKEALGEKITKKLLLVSRRTVYDSHRAHRDFSACADRYLLDQENIEIESPEDDEEELVWVSGETIYPNYSVKFKFLPTYLTV